ncbi:hypothetical protein B296_00015947 [Ensete ventricosum]|uniref:Alanyl-tRNA synthetase class IIc N-terminal domain-containing protein n=1 Tax=Ensete ventricosum TaxID=4639 RepID=A0A427B1L5_ENSVE|nr:hypothetical protein B296_00015947 [Ensete ventricosum]
MISSLVGVVTKVMGDVFPELKQYESKIQEILADEEASFGRTLLKGIEKFKKAAQDVHGSKISGQACLLSTFYDDKLFYLSLYAVTSYAALSELVSV